MEHSNALARKAQIRAEQKTGSWGRLWGRLGCFHLSMPKVGLGSRTEEPDFETQCRQKQGFYSV